MWRWLAVSLPLLVVSCVLWRYWPQPREAVYSLYREHSKERTIAGLQGYKSQSSDHFEVLYTEHDENVIDMILETAEKVYDPVLAEVGYQPPGKVPMIVYDSRDSLRQAFGWGQSESAMGVYWTGTIRLLSPNVWIDEKGEGARRKVFNRLNPIAHELTHYLLDYLTNGNYPRWFTEGLAQRVEYKVTGYLWIESRSTLKQELYSLDDLQNRFDHLRNQPLAYRQSFLMVDYMARRYGEDGLKHLVALLGQGVDFPVAVQKAFGVSIAELHTDWLVWVKDNLDQLESKE